jgi:uncharacterized protein YjbI with pentapeptide repeats
MELKTIYGALIFSLDTAKSVLELVTAAVAAKKSLRGAYLRGAYLRGADLRGKKIHSLRAYSSDLYPYQVWAVLNQEGSRMVRMGCLWHTVEGWDEIGIRQSNTSEFPDDGSEVSEDRAAMFEVAKAAALRMSLPVQEAVPHA